MNDANGSRFALLLGPADWGGCALVAEPAGESAGESAADAASPRLAALWADPARRSATPLEFDEPTGALALTRRVARFRAGAADTLPAMAERLGAAADGNGNLYWVSDGGRRIAVLSSGSRQVSVFWSMQAAPGTPAPTGNFAPRAAPGAVPRQLRGLAVTLEHYLVAGLLPQGPLGGGLLIFDLLAGGPPLAVGWPALWPFVPYDLAARPGGGVAVLDRSQRRVWMLDRRLGMGAVFPVDAGAAPLPGDFAPPGAAPAAAGAARAPWFALTDDGAGGADPVALDVLADDGVLVMDGEGSDGFAWLSIYADGALAGRASTRAALDVIDADDRAGFVLRGFDCALQAVAAGAPARVVVASHEGNQCLAFDLMRGSPGLVLDPVESFLPLRRFDGKGLVRAADVSGIPGDTGLLYASQGSWLPLVEQRRPRFAPRATLLTPPLDGRQPDCVWHRLVIDGCLPGNCQLRVETRAADLAGQLAGLPFYDEPSPVLRPDGAELPWLLDGPGAATDPARGTGCWELLFQRARGRYLQIRLTLAGDELATPRLVALRAWYPRFSYAREYLPAVYRDDDDSADFLERFLANFEGMFTSLEDRIAASSALFDLRSAPAATLDWLAGWLGLALDPAMDETRRRQLIRFAIPLYQYRGTTQGLRLAVQLALSDRVSAPDFALPAASQRQPYGVRIVEHYLTRRLPRVLLGETVVDDTTFADSATPRQLTASQRWSPVDGAGGLHQRYRDWLVQAGVADAPGALFTPLPPAAHAALWRSFCIAELGSIPQLADALQQAWTSYRQSGRAADLGADLPGRWPAGATQQQAWRDFIDGALSADLHRWLARWQGFVARRHGRIENYQSASGLNWPQFDLLPAPIVLPEQTAVLADWMLFETQLEPMAAAAHRFSVLLPSSGPLASAGELAQEIALATRVVRLAKPAHTTFDVRQYWALFRVGQARLGLDSQLGKSSRAPELAPQIVVGAGQVGAGRVAPRRAVPADRILLES